MATAQHGERGGGGAVDGHALDHRPPVADPACGADCIGFVLRRDDDRGQPAEGRHGGMSARIGFRFVEARDVSRDQCFDDGRGRIVRLDEDAAGLFPAPRASGHLHDLLEAALGRAQVAALEREIGIDHADQREVGEVVALGDQLGAHDDVDVARLHRADEFGGARGGPDGVGGDDRSLRVGEQCRDFVGDALDTRATGHQRVFLAAFGAFGRRGHDVAAMVARQPCHQPVFDHPGGAVGALEAVAAIPAQRQRGETAAVEEQERLLARLEIGLEFAHQRGREPALAVGRVLRQVDGAQFGQFGGGVPLGEPHFFVAPDLDHVAGLDGGGRGGEEDGDFLEVATHHRDVAGVVLDALLLLETGLVRLVDDDQAEPCIREEQARAGADDHFRFAGGDRPPGTTPFGGAQVGMPRDGFAAEAAGEAGEEGLGERDFGEQDEDLVTVPDC